MKSRRTILLFAIALGFTVGALASLLHFRRQPKAEPDELSSAGLYTDDEIRPAAPYDIIAETKSARSVLDMPILPVVPNGSTCPRAEVFRELGLDDSRIRGFRAVPAGKIAFLWWQVSPSYDIVCMTGTVVGGFTDAELSDPQRPIYGLRLVSRAERNHIYWR